MYVWQSILEYLILICLLSLSLILKRWLIIVVSSRDKASQDSQKMTVANNKEECLSDEMLDKVAYTRSITVVTASKPKVHAAESLDEEMLTGTGTEMISHQHPS